MTTILEAEFGSDEDDSDYVLSEASSEEEEEGFDKKLKREKKRQELVERVNSLFDRMKSQSDVCYRHPNTHEKDDFMLQFHRKSNTKPKIRDPAEFESYLGKNTSRVFESDLQLNIRDFKRKCHQTPNSEKLEMVKNAVSVKDDEPATVKTTYKFAGTTYEVIDKVSKRSKKYSNYLKKKEKELGGNFAFLDEMYSKLGPAPTLSAVSKSEIDWSTYKDQNNLEAELRQNYHHLKEQEFLERTTWKEYERELKARRQ